jgi:hypothetical protein
MKDRKFRILCILGIVWALLFLITMRVKAPMLEGVEVVVTFSAIAWFFYWTLSAIKWAKKPEPTHNLGDHLTGKCGCSETKESEQSNAPEKETIIK